jgi:hypothetical protein
MNEGHHFSNRDYHEPQAHGDDLHDGDLRDRFASLRREDAHHVPEFARLWRRREHVARHKGRRIAIAACALIALAIFWLRSAQHKSHDAAVASITEWNSPTDFLLETPGRELLRTVPEIGQWRGYTAPTTPENRSSPVGKEFL